MNTMRIPLALTAASVAGLVVALVEGGVVGAVGVLLVAVPLVAVVAAFVLDRRRKNAP